MRYDIIVTDYVLDEEGIVIDQDGGMLSFNDVDDFIMMFQYFKGGHPLKNIIDDGEFLIIQPREIEPFVTDYQITGDAYKVWKEWEAKKREKYDAMIANANNNEELPF